MCVHGPCSRGRECAVPQAIKRYLLQVMMWEVFMSRQPFLQTLSGVEKDPNFPSFPTVCPFNYAVLSMACMAQNPEDRPSMNQIFEVLTSLEVDLATGTFFDWTGSQRVRHIYLPDACQALCPTNCSDCSGN